MSRVLTSAQGATTSRSSVSDESGPAAVRRHLRVRGVVQGVGFRPFVHRLATECGLAGLVGNDEQGVFIEVEGAPGDVAAFEDRLTVEAPRLARIDAVTSSGMEPTGTQGFVIVASREAEGSTTGSGAVALVPADTAVCDDCLRETFDPHDRRYRYPFTACTYCGPRFTMVTGLPYDRPYTTMAGFPLCPQCQAEYEDPGDRRFHAQPTACPRCGPSLLLRVDGRDVAREDAALAGALDVLRGGGVVAVKGLGGYHLACDAEDPTAVAELRRRKQRSDKPFAVMVPDVDAARRLVEVDDLAQAELTSPVAPIVILAVAQTASAHDVADAVAPRTGTVGVMLPYTPLHHLLFRPHPLRDDGWAPRALVLTSGNLSDEPICIDPDEAEDRLAGLADAFVHHDRPIHVACDDSVERIAGSAQHRTVLPVRRSRGHAPVPVRLAMSAPPLLAVGGELKATVCVTSGEQAWLSQHLGDVSSLATLQALERAVDVLCSLARVQPEAVVADLHPGYLSQRWARERAAAGDLPCLLVQHHHAHLASLLAEHHWPMREPVLGFAFDGTGYGTDGTVWGGELLLGSYASADRVGHLAPVQLPGGDAAVQHPARMALSHLAAAGITADPALPLVTGTSDVERRVVEGMLRSGTGCVPTTSMGRLFDAVAAIAGVTGEATYEGQAAVELEALSAAAGPAGTDLDLRLPVSADLVLDPAPLVRGCVAAVLRGAEPARVGRAFHEALAAAMLQAARLVRQREGVHVVGLTGGVFQNALLTRLGRASLEADGFTVLVHETVPANDGGLALGQAAVAACGGAKESG